jgi:hypothetical protein
MRRLEAYVVEIRSIKLRLRYLKLPVTRISSSLANPHASLPVTRSSLRLPVGFDPRLRVTKFDPRARHKQQHAHCAQTKLRCWPLGLLSVQCTGMPVHWHASAGVPPPRHAPAIPRVDLSESLPEGPSLALLVSPSAGARRSWAASRPDLPPPGSGHSKAGPPPSPAQVKKKLIAGPGPGPLETFLKSRTTAPVPLRMIM